MSPCNSHLEEKERAHECIQKKERGRARERLFCFPFRFVFFCFTQGGKCLMKIGRSAFFLSLSHSLPLKIPVAGPKKTGDRGADAFFVKGTQGTGGSNGKKFLLFSPSI